MTIAFTYAGSPATIVFRAGARAEIGEWVERLGCRKALVLSTPTRSAEAEALASELGERSAGIFAGAVMHTPIEVTETAIARLAGSGADCLVALGGGSTIGLGKAIGLRTELPQIAVPTTYAGSEATPILGQTERGVKTTLRDPRVLPEVVIYDPDLTLALPIATSVASGLNAMAHAAEGLYAADRNPVSTLMAAEGLRAMKRALPAIGAEPRAVEARTDALYGAWLCGTVLGSVGMALHHKLCHVLGGSFGMPHAEVHAVLLPHTIGFNAGAVPDLLRPVEETFGGPPGAALWDFARALEAPLALRALGLEEADLDRAAEMATTNPYRNPRPIVREDIRRLLQAAWEGSRPQQP